MIETELTKSGCYIKPSVFKFQNGHQKSGMLSIYFQDAPDDFFLVPLENIKSFTRELEQRNYGAMRKLCEKIDINEIVDASPL